jgi:hypothetical protein
MLEFGYQTSLNQSLNRSLDRSPIAKRCGSVGMMWRYLEIPDMGSRCMVEKTRQGGKRLFILARVKGTLDTSTFNQTVEMLVYQMTPQGINAWKLVLTTAGTAVGTRCSPAKAGKRSERTW